MKILFKEDIRGYDDYSDNDLYLLLQDIIKERGEKEKEIGEINSKLELDGFKPNHAFAQDLIVALKKEKEFLELNDKDREALSKNNLISLRTKLEEEIQELNVEIDNLNRLVQERGQINKGPIFDFLGLDEDEDQEG